MAQINVPKDLLQKEAFKTLPAKEKEEYLRNLLKKVLELNPEGITISQIKEATGLTYSTLWHHLEILNSTAQCHKISRGNVDVYHATGKLNHLNDHDYGKVRYTIGTVEDNEGKFIYIHEKRENRLGNHIVCRGVHVPLELIGNFIKTLEEVKESKKAVRVTAEELFEEGLIKKEGAKAEELLEEGLVKKEEKTIN